MPDDPADYTPPQQTFAAELRWQSRCLLVLATIAVGAMLYVLRPVLVPFVVAVFLTVGLKPILDGIQRRLLPSRLVAVSVAFLLGVLMIASLSTAIVGSVESLAHDEAYQESAREAATRIANIAVALRLLPEDLPEHGSDENGGAEDDAAKDDADGGPRLSVTSNRSNTSRLFEAIREGTKEVQEWVLGGLAALSSSMSIVLIYMFFLLLGASDTGHASGELWTMIEQKLREYIVLKTVISLATGIAVWLVLWIFGVPLALVFGMLTFLLNYIPNFGPLVTCLLPLPVIWLHPDLNVLGMLMASLLSCGVQLAGGNIIEPKLMGSSFDLHPIVVLLALMLWFAIWGFVGMLLAVPMTAALKVVLDRVERTKPIARLLAGDLDAIKIG